MTGTRDHFPTEQRNPASAGLDAAPTGEAFDIFQAEDERMVAAVAGVRAEVCQAVDLVAERLARGGRLLYVGAGTSGRLGVLDASECPPTFLTDPGTVQGVIAGGPAALTTPVEGVEDNEQAARTEMEEREVSTDDVVFGLTAGGTTRFVHAALACAKERGAATVFLACVPAELAPDEADVSIRIATGPEVLAGSTRLKAGTATKLVLNRVTTLAMARLGKVHDNLMVDVDASANAKLIERATSLVATLTGIDREAARARLEEAGWRVKTACVMEAHGIDRAAAEKRLTGVGGVLRRALTSPATGS